MFNKSIKDRKHQNKTLVMFNVLRGLYYVLFKVRRSCSRASKENFSDFELPTYENEPDLTAEISQQLKQMTGTF